MAEATEPQRPLSLPALAWFFFRVGATAFGETELSSSSGSWSSAVAC